MESDSVTLQFVRDMSEKLLTDPQLFAVVPCHLEHTYYIYGADSL